jgi:SAM-dependent methyltransferase
MRSDFDRHRDVWGPVLAVQLRAWSDAFFKPAATLRELGLFRPGALGAEPAPRLFAGGGPAISAAEPGLHLLGSEPPGYERMRQFDAAAAEYRTAVEPFSGPIFARVLDLLGPHLVPDARLLDPACGPGTEAIALAERVPEGEVIASDLSRGMISEAYANARRAALTNMAFFQRDAEELPAGWSGAFDAVICILSFHYFVDAAAAAAGFARVLAPGGKVFVADPGPSWFHALAEPLARLANPAFVGYRTGEQLLALLASAGLVEPFWTEVLPGIGVAIATRP